MCLCLMQLQHLLQTGAPLGFSSGLLLWLLLLSLQFSVRPQGQQRRSHLDMIKLEMPKKKKSHIQSVSRTDMWDFIYFHALLISSHPSLQVLSFLNCFDSNSSLFLSFLLIFPSSGTFWWRAFLCSADCDHVFTCSNLSLCARLQQLKAL